jgi:hypothetical protein
MLQYDKDEIFSNTLFRKTGKPLYVHTLCSRQVTILITHILDFRSGAVEVSVVLRYCAASVADWCLTFRDI